MRHYFPWDIEREDADGNSIVYEVEIKGTYRFGAPASGPTYYSGGEPAEPDEFEFEVLGLPSDVTLTDEEISAIETYAYDNPPEDDYYD